MVRKRKPSLDIHQQLQLTDASQLPALMAETPEDPSVNYAKAYWTVTDVIQHLSDALDNHPILGDSFTVRGELSNVRPASSGHVYATLKDDAACLNVVLWRSTAQKLPFRIEDGLAVLATGKLNVYAPGGSVSMVVSSLVPDGMGLLQLAFEQLKTRLTEEGLFDEDRKQALPVFPLRIGIVTSPTGSVIHDMWRVIRQKNPLVQVLLCPVAVQGQGACNQIADAIDQLNDARFSLDAIIVARGGGSFEDLFCFSEEPVVRAIARSRLPVVTGIGHQPDFSLADAVADYSAATPTAAANALIPDIDAWQQWLDERQTLLQREVMRRVEVETQRLDVLTERMRDGLQQHLVRANQQLDSYGQGLVMGVNYQLQSAEQQLATLSNSLHELSPLATLARGYGVVSTHQLSVVQSVTQLKVKEAFTLTLSDGQLKATVTEIRPSKD